MSMAGEIATAGTVEEIVREIKRELAEGAWDAGARSALKKIGRFALTCFDYTTPGWAGEYAELFKEQG